MKKRQKEKIMNARFVKHNGEWAIKIEGNANGINRGSVVSIRKANGGTSKVTLGRMLDHGRGYWIHAIEKSENSAENRPAQRPSSTPDGVYRGTLGKCGKSRCLYGEDASSFCRIFGGCPLADC